ncbi:response regulator [Prosthecomicrobium hirschii]|uniref:response regulator n=2 Tax=Prosthecodimorpha hirschii TaxID=665126 RepID=UPI00221F535D|nr:response regulator [Prosthecomicrobium hirschii]MCW1841528.1 response regulator [Prosthecomicrobium hirschii]
MESTPHILVVEDDQEIRALVARYLKANGLRVTTAPAAREMDRILQEARIDLLVLDVNLPGEDGFSICRRLRNGTPLPIIMLTARTEEIDRVLGLEMGADDYLGKPFSPRELLARIRAVLRRRPDLGPGYRSDRRSRQFAGWRFEPLSANLSSPSGTRVPLTGAESDLLAVLSDNSGRILSRDALLDLTRGRAAGPFDRSVDVLISRLRQKIEVDPRDPQLIRTIRGNGYLFTAEVLVE